MPKTNKMTVKIGDLPTAETIETETASHGHSASLPKEYYSSGYVEPMEQQTAQATVTPTPAAPTAMPTSKPTTQQTQMSPAPFVGLIAGLGIAGLVLGRLRK